MRDDVSQAPNRVSIFVCERKRNPLNFGLKLRNEIPWVAGI
jgi:hypothetical protein